MVTFLYSDWINYDGVKISSLIYVIVFRDASRENILEHVKGHYRQDGVMDLSMDHESQSEPQLLLDDEVSNVPIGDAPFRCGHCNQVSNWKHVIQVLLTQKQNKKKR